jgi:hypothetical protein
LLCRNQSHRQLLHPPLLPLPAPMPPPEQKATLTSTLVPFIVQLLCIHELFASLSSARTTNPNRRNEIYCCPSNLYSDVPAQYPILLVRISTKSQPQKLDSVPRIAYWSRAACSARTEDYLRVMNGLLSRVENTQILQFKTVKITAHDQTKTVRFWLTCCRMARPVFLYLRMILSVYLPHPVGYITFGTFRTIGQLLKTNIHQPKIIRTSLKWM